MEKGVDEGRIGGSGCVAQAQGQGQLRRFVAGRVLRQLSRHFLLVHLIPRHPQPLFGWSCSESELHLLSRLSLINLFASCLRRRAPRRGQWVAPKRRSMALSTRPVNTSRN